MESKELQNEPNNSVNQQEEINSTLAEVNETEPTTTDLVAESTTEKGEAYAPEADLGSGEETLTSVEAEEVATIEASLPEAEPLKTEVLPSESENEEPEMLETNSENKPSNEVPSNDNHSEESHSEEVSEDEQDTVVNLVDYDSFSKEQLLAALEELTSDNTGKRVDGDIKKVKQAFENLNDAERSEAQAKFVSEGGAEEDFKYKHDELTAKFEAVHHAYREKRRSQAQAAEKQKEERLKAKTSLLEQLKALVDGEETKNSINTLRKIQEEWKAVGPLSGSNQREFSASYGVLLDKYYNRRSIYFELKEFDRKKNLEAKQEIIARAEKLLTEGSLNKAVKDLNDLHEEFKNIGPAPKEEQDVLWAKLKTISDQIYTVRREMLEKLHTEQAENLEKKTILFERLENAIRLKTDRIDNWNQQSAEVMKIREEWEAIGSVPRDKSGDLNKKFWNNVKQFFNDKTKFFKELEETRNANLRAKTSLCEEAEALKEDAEWNSILDAVKDLQERWKQVGPLPFKYKNSLYDRFKAAIDGVFERRRAQNAHIEDEFNENLKSKLEIIEKIEGFANDKTGDIETLRSFEDEFAAIGFVPRKSINTVQERYAKAIESYLLNSDEITEADRNKYRPAGGQRRRNDGPSNNSGGNQNRDRENGGNRNNNTGGNNRNANNRGGGDNRDRGGDRDRDRDRDRGQRNDHRINTGSPEMVLRKKISQVEDQIHQWNNNLSYFANSRNADALRKEVAGKVALLEKDLTDLKEQLKTLQTEAKNQQ